MPGQYTLFDSVPEYLAALRELVESGLPVTTWENKSLLESGFETSERRIAIKLSTFRSHYRRIGTWEQYDAVNQRFKEDVARVLHSATTLTFEVGRTVVSRSHGRETPHHGKVEAVTDLSVTIRHDPDCCEPDLLSVVALDIAHQHWKQIIVRRSAWERLLDDD